MYTQRIIIFLFCCLSFKFGFAQDPKLNMEVVSEQIDSATAEADIKSYELYTAGKWFELLNYGKEAITKGADFPLLRMRTGYSALMMGNYSQSLLQYQNVLDKEPDNRFALYYVYLNNVYLNNTAAARYYAGKLPEETKEVEKLKKTKLAWIQTEYSYKAPQDVTRGNAQYGRVGAGIQLGYRTELQQSVAFYHQKISEPKYTGVTNNTNINIEQKEYYAKLVVATSGKLSLIGAFHYLNTPFNNLAFNNVIFSAGIKYTMPYAQLQAMAHVATLTDSAYNQLDGILTLYPLGNLSLYTITRASYGDNFTFAQVAGLKLHKNIWLEGNVTLGTYRTLLENDALYVYNDVDTKLFKAGASIYASINNNTLLTLNYTFDQKQRIFTTGTNFYQNSINGGLTWRF